MVQKAADHPSWIPGHLTPPDKRQLPDGTWWEVYNEGGKEYWVACMSPEEAAADELERLGVVERVKSGEIRREARARAAEARRLAELLESEYPDQLPPFSQTLPPVSLPSISIAKSDKSATPPAKTQLRLVFSKRAKRPARAKRPRTVKAGTHSSDSTIYAVSREVQVGYLKKVLASNKTLKQHQLKLGNESQSLGKDRFNNRIRAHVLTGLGSERSTWVEAIRINGHRVRHIRQDNRSFYVLVDEHHRRVVELFNDREYNKLVTKSEREQQQTERQLQRRSKRRQPMRLPRLGRERLVA